MSYFGINIKKIRVAKKLSQTKFAEIFELTRAAIGAYEEGRAEAKIDNIIEIAKYFNITLEQLLTKKLTINEIYNFDKIENSLNLINKNIFQQIPFIKYKKKIEYIKNINNLNFIQKQDYIILPNIPNKHCRAFEYYSNDIDFYEHSILICKKKDKKKSKIEQDKKYFQINNDDFFISNFDISNNNNILEVWEIIGIYSQNINLTDFITKKFQNIDNKIEKILEKIQ